MYFLFSKCQLIWNWNIYISRVSFRMMICQNKFLVMLNSTTKILENIIWNNECDLVKISSTFHRFFLQ